MLPLRLIIVLSLFGVALWGLFSLLENLREPELLRSTKAVVVKGCDPPESEDAQRVCPQLLCQKALLDARLLPIKTDFSVTIDTRAGTQQLIGGSAHSGDAEDASFACILERGKPVNADVVDEIQLQELASQPGDWYVEEAEEAAQ